MQDQKPYEHAGQPPSTSHYTKGCRCQGCVAAVREYRRRYTARKNAGIHTNLRSRRNWAAEAVMLPFQPDLGLNDEQRAVLAKRHTALVAISAVAEADGYVPRGALILLGRSAGPVVAELAESGLVTKAGDDIFLDFPWADVSQLLSALPEIAAKVEEPVDTQTVVSGIQDAVAAEIQATMGPVAADPMQYVRQVVEKHAPERVQEPPAGVPNHGVIGHNSEDDLVGKYHAILGQKQLVESPQPVKRRLLGKPRR